jgi:hypothetical protein
MNLWKRPRAKNVRNRRAMTKTGAPLVLSLVPATCTFSTPNITVTFGARFVLKGIPQWLTDTDKLPTSVTKLSPVSIRLAYATPGSVTKVVVPERDPALRSTSGGYVAAGTFLAPAP